MKVIEMVDDENVTTAVLARHLAPAIGPELTEDAFTAGPTSTIDELRAIVFDTRETKSVVDRLIHGLHPFVALAIVPVFANAKIAILVASVLASVGGAVMMLTAPAPAVAGAPSDDAVAVADPDQPSADLGPITYDELEATAPESFLANGTAGDRSVEDQTSSSN